MSIQRLSPDTMHKNPAYSQAVVVDGNMRFVYVGGQNGVSKEGKVVSKDIGSQSKQALLNVQAALEAAGASFKDVFKMTIFLVHGQSIQEAFGAAMQVIPPDTPPSIVTVILVAGLGVPDALLEIEAVAAI